MTLKRWACLLMVVLPLLAVVLALCPAVAQAQETNHNNASAERLVVAPGDCLWSISEQQLGPGATPQQIAHEVELIYALNRNTIGDDPNTIFAGQRLSLPPAVEHQALEHQAAEEPSEEAAPAGEAARAPAMGGSPADVPAEHGSQQRRAGEAAAAVTQEEAEPPTLPAVAGVAAVPTARLVAGDPPALVEFFALDGPYAERRLLGLGIMLVSLLIGAATLARVAWQVVDRRRRRRRSYYPRAYGSAAYRGAYAPFIPDLRASSSESRPLESRPSERSREEADRAAPSEEYRRPFAVIDHRPRRARRLPGGDWGQKDHALMLNGRRQAVVGVNPNVPEERNEEWEIDEPLRRALESLPLQPGAPMLQAVTGLKPHVEEALKSLALLEHRRSLSEYEHRQADTLRGLLMSIGHTLGNKRGR